MNEGITCIARIRPLLGEVEEKSDVGVFVEEKSTLSVKNPLRSSYGAKQFKMTENIMHNVGQQEVFDRVLPHMEKALLGYNTSFFTYGPTGTGKTYTTLGYDFHAMLDSKVSSPSKRPSTSPTRPSPYHSPSKRLSASTSPSKSGRSSAPEPEAISLDFNMLNSEEAGLIPRALEWILDIKKGEGSEIEIKMSYMEVYNESIKDLLSSTQNKNSNLEKPLYFNNTVKGTSQYGAGLDVSQDADGNVCVPGLTEVEVTSLPQALQLLYTAAAARKTSSTSQNQYSSRSHCIFTLQLVRKSNLNDGSTQTQAGRVVIVDLAGCEKARGEMSSVQRKELATINRSLSALTKVVQALAEMGRRARKSANQGGKEKEKEKEHSEASTPSADHIPYRDSKLTRVLKGSLGGKSLSVFICTVSPSSVAREETLATMSFADRAMRVQITAKPNEVQFNATSASTNYNDNSNGNGNAPLNKALSDENTNLRSMLSFLSEENQRLSKGEGVLVKAPDNGWESWMQSLSISDTVDTVKVGANRDKVDEFTDLRNKNASLEDKLRAAQKMLKGDLETGTDSDTANTANTAAGAQTESEAEKAIVVLKSLIKSHDKRYGWLLRCLHAHKGAITTNNNGDDSDDDAEYTTPSISTQALSPQMLAERLSLLETSVLLGAQDISEKVTHLDRLISSNQDIALNNKNNNSTDNTASAIAVKPPTASPQNKRLGQHRSALLPKKAFISDVDVSSVDVIPVAAGEENKDKDEDNVEKAEEKEEKKEEGMEEREKPSESRPDPDDKTTVDTSESPESQGDGNTSVTIDATDAKDTKETKDTDNNDKAVVKVKRVPAGARKLMKKKMAATVKNFEAESDN